MKKIITGILLAGLMMLLCCQGVAEALPKVTFVQNSGAVNGGFTYELALRVNKALEEDLQVSILNGKTGESITAVIPAGEKQVAVSVETESVEKKEKVVFTLEKNDACTTEGKHSLTLHPMPKVKFYQAVNLGQLGKKMNVKVECGGTSNILKGYNTMQLRNQDGTVLAEKAWPIGKTQLTFTFDVTEELLGRQDLSVWLGEYKVTEKDGYGSLADVSEKVVVELAPEVPLMAIGIDCAYDDSKTDQILNVLDQHGVKATFFMTGYFMRTFPEAALKIRDAGHEIANHSNTHPHMPELSEYDKYRQIMRPAEEAEALMEITPRLFRPPFGEFNNRVTSICRGEGMEVVMWTMSYKDSGNSIPREKMMSLATEGQDYGPGSIVLCHLDGWCMPDTLENGLTYYESLGLKAVPISALIYASGRELPPMPDARQPLKYTDDYWPNWIRENVPEYAWVLDKE